LETSSNNMMGYFDSKTDLINAVLASAFIPFFSGFMPIK
jgi:hypothetical protein